MIISSKSNKKEEAEKEEIFFPILMAHIKWDFIVLFTSEYRGIVVYGSDQARPVGYGAGIDWISCFDINSWKEFDGVISLVNKKS